MAELLMLKMCGGVDNVNDLVGVEHEYLPLTFIHLISYLYLHLHIYSKHLLISNNPVFSYSNTFTTIIHFIH